jgi:hypothetical protein
MKCVCFDVYLRQDWNLRVLNLNGQRSSQSKPLISLRRGVIAQILAQEISKQQS